MSSRVLLVGRIAMLSNEVGRQRAVRRAARVKGKRKVIIERLDKAVGAAIVVQPGALDVRLGWSITL
jgi:hypothetical protein